MDDQIQNAIDIAGNATSDPNLKAQAIEFINQIRSNPSAWQASISLFTRDPHPSDLVRHFCLEILNEAIQSRRLDAQGLRYVKDSLVNYVRKAYGPGRGQGDVDSAHIQNKLAQTFTYLFVSLYATGWESFFQDFRALAGQAGSIGTTNVAATMLYLRIIVSVHDEIADLLVPRTSDEQKRNNDLKDLVRARDAKNISISWQEILSQWRQSDTAVVELCLRAVSRWVSWIDIALVVNESMLNIILQLALQLDIPSSESSQALIRAAALETLTETVGKKMKPSDKIELLLVLNVDNIVGQLVAIPALLDFRKTPKYDTDLAENVAKLVNAIADDIVKALDTESTDDQTRQRADGLLQIFVPFLLRFFADEYDEICSTVIPSVTDLLTYFRKFVKTKGSLTPQYSAMLAPILNAIVAKMRYDDTSAWGAEDEETDEAEFQELRKRLHVLQQVVAAVDETLYINTLSNIVGNIFQQAGNKDENLNWRDLDLAMHEMYLFGELAVKNGGMYQKTKPSSAAAERLAEMMTKMVESDIASSSHPAIELQFMESCVRYCAFFEHHPQYIPKVLNSFVRFVHSDHVKVRTRSWYLFHRYVKHLRAQLGNVSQTVIQSIADLLTIKAELPDDSVDEDASSDAADQSADAIFSSQLYLFDAIGNVSSTSSVPIDNQILYAKSVMNPLFSDMEQHLSQAENGDERATLQIHHIIMALGTLARGFSEWMPGASGSPPPAEVSEEFVPAAEAILVALEALKSSMHIRTAARFAFSRMFGVLGSRILQQLPRWIDGLLSQSSTKDEMATFLKALDQVIFGFKAEIYGILDSLLTPLLQRVFAGLAEPTTGTDDEIQLSELRREYLNFLLVILNNDLASVLVSPTNQSTFDTIITTIAHFASDPADLPTARLAISLLTKFALIWGGPDTPLPPQSSSTPSSSYPLPSPMLPGFDTFMITRFSPLSWALPANQNFNPKDPQARAVLGEVAGLQQAILRKCGGRYLEWLTEDLKRLGLGDAEREAYLAALRGMDGKGFKAFFVNFVSRGGG